MTTASEPAALRIEAAEHMSRVERVRAELEARGLGCLVVFGATRIAYLTGFFHIHTERPIVLVIGAGGETALLIPLLEQDHAEAVLDGMRLAVYAEYPGPSPHPMQTLAGLIADLGLDGDPVGCDHDGYHDVNGYEGPPLSEVVRAPVVPARDIVDSMRMVKSEAELELLRMSAAWGDAAFSELRATIRPGVAPREVGLEASIATMRRMTAELGPTYRPLLDPARLAGQGGAQRGRQHGLPARLRWGGPAEARRRPARIRPLEAAPQRARCRPADARAAVRRSRRPP
jgi:Xaa-Pro aminopeptidase